MRRLCAAGYGQVLAQPAGG